MNYQFLWTLVRKRQIHNLHKWVWAVERVQNTFWQTNDLFLEHIQNKELIVIVVITNSLFNGTDVITVRSLFLMISINQIVYYAKTQSFWQFLILRNSTFTQDYISFETYKHANKNLRPREEQDAN